MPAVVARGSVSVGHSWIWAAVLYLPGEEVRSSSCGDTRLICAIVQRQPTVTSATRSVFAIAPVRRFEASQAPEHAYGLSRRHGRPKRYLERGRSRN